MEKTAIQKSIDKIRQRIKNRLDKEEATENESYKFMHGKVAIELEQVFQELRQLLETERKQMIEFGDVAQRTNFYCKFQSMEEAFESKYKN